MKQGGCINLRAADHTYQQRRADDAAEETPAPLHTIDEKGRRDGARCREAEQAADEAPVGAGFEPDSTRLARVPVGDAERIPGPTPLRGTPPAEEDAYPTPGPYRDQDGTGSTARFAAIFGRSSSDGTATTTSAPPRSPAAIPVHLSALS